MVKMENTNIEIEVRCEFCDNVMTQEEHDFCDICGDCLEENNY